MAAWAIRRDSSPQSGGTVVASDVSPATQTPIAGNELLPRDSVVGYRIQVSGLHVRLAPGRYWLNVAPVGSGKSFVSSTRGKNAVGNPPGNNGLALLDSPARGLLFELAEMVGKSGQFGIGKDFSQGVLIVDNVNSK
jgi:hypothetical protein